jgi:hypothetical protein
VRHHHIAYDGVDGTYPLKEREAEGSIGRLVHAVFPRQCLHDHVANHGIVLDHQHFGVRWVAHGSRRFGGFGRNRRRSRWRSIPRVDRTEQHARELLASLQRLLVGRPLEKARVDRARGARGGAVRFRPVGRHRTYTSKTVEARRT